jgi:hypothetical protein
MEISSCESELEERKEWQNTLLSKARFQVFDEVSEVQAS